MYVPLVFLLTIIQSICTLNHHEKYLLPRIIQHPKSQIVSSQTKRVQFKCDYDTIDITTLKTTLASSSFIDIKWLFNLDKLIKSVDYQVEQNRLIINNFSPERHLGEYRCLVNNTIIAWAILSEPANLTLAYMDTNADKSTQIVQLNAIEGNVAVIPCKMPTSSPLAVPTFIVNDTLSIDIQQKQDKYKLFMSSGNLHIFNVQSSDSGLYSCSSKNPITHEIRNNTLKVRLRVQQHSHTSQTPQIVLSPVESNRVQIGSNLTLECVASGSPVPTITWEKFGGSLPTMRSIKIFGNLMLTNIQLEDRGTYVCRADNGHATYKTAMIDVFEAPTLLSLNDGITINSLSQQIVKYYANLNDNIELKCPIRSRPKADIQWFFNTHALASGKLTAYIITDRSLLIKQVNHDLIGVYQCFARNEYGFKQAQILLQLKDDDKFSFINKNDVPHTSTLVVQRDLSSSLSSTFGSKPKILMGPQNTTIYEGQSVVLLCLTESNSLINWLQNDIIIEPSLMRRFEISQVGNLRIVSAQKSDSGVYKCIASNEFGMSTSESYVLVKDDEPKSNQLTDLNVDSAQQQIYRKTQKKQLPFVTKPQIEQIDTDKILLKWSTSEYSSSNSTNDLIDFFKIEYKTSSSSLKQWVTIDEQIDPFKREYILTDLSTNEYYRFRIMCSYKNSLQSYSHASIKFKLEESFVPMVRQTVNNSSSSSSSSGSKSQINIKIEEVWPLSDTSLALKWKLDSNLTSIDGLTVYYRKKLDNEFIKIQLPLITDTYILSNLDASTKYELKITCNQCKMSSSLYGTTLSSSLKSSKSINLNEISMMSHLITQIIPTQNQTISTNSNEILFMILGIVLGILILLLVIFIIMCIIRHRQHKMLLTKLKSQSQKLHTGSSCPTLIYDDCLKQNSNKTFSTLANSQNSNSSSDTTTPPQQLPQIPQVPPPPLTLTRLSGQNGMNLNINPLGYLDSNTIAYTLMKQQQQQHQPNNENFYHTLTTLGTLKTVPFGDYNNTTLNLRHHFIKQQQHLPSTLTRQSFSSSSTTTSLAEQQPGDTSTRQSRKRRQTNTNRRVKRASYERRPADLQTQVANNSQTANVNDNLLIDDNQTQQQPATIIPQSKLDENFQFLFNFEPNNDQHQQQENEPMQ